jgi:RNA polymerase sigma-70 factor (ECF subfamily)
VERAVTSTHTEPDIDRGRALQQLSRLIRTLKPLDRQIMIFYLEEMDTASIADITGLSAANVAMKIHRIKNILLHRFQEAQDHVR